MTYIQRWNGITISSGLGAPAFYLFINLFKTHEWSAKVRGKQTRTENTTADRGFPIGESTGTDWLTTIRSRVSFSVDRRRLRVRAVVRCCILCNDSSTRSKLYCNYLPFAEKRAVAGQKTYRSWKQFKHYFIRPNSLFRARFRVVMLRLWNCQNGGGRMFLVAITLSSYILSYVKFLQSANGRI